MEQGERPDCCLPGQENIQWRIADHCCGPDVDSWTIAFHGQHDVYFTEVYFCPFCGDKLFYEPLTVGEILRHQKVVNDLKSDLPLPPV